MMVEDPANNEEIIHPSFNEAEWTKLTHKTRKDRPASLPQPLQAGKRQTEEAVN
jgi:hypothetical protein